MTYTITETPTRVAALDSDGIEICGAFQPEGHDYWSLYVTKLIGAATGLTVPPHREHFWNDLGRTAVRAWVELIAALYCMAMENQQ